MERKRLNRQESRHMTKTLLIDAAEGIFLREGFDHASVEQITEAAGFSRGAFYSNFIDKDHLLLAVLDKRRRDAASALKFFQGISSPVQQQKALRGWIVQQWRKTDCIALRAELSRRAQRNPALRSRLSEFYREEIRTIEQNLPLGIAPPSVIAIALIGASYGIGSMGFQESAELDLYCESAIRLLFDRLLGADAGAPIKQHETESNNESAT
jgi:AcrR family transcriptional regulator